jgi:hypothetical protein
MFNVKMPLPQAHYLICEVLKRVEYLRTRHYNYADLDAVYSLPLADVRTVSYFDRVCSKKIWVNNLTLGSEGGAYYRAAQASESAASA